MKYTLVLFTFIFSFSAFAEVKIGILNIQKIITSTKEGKTISASMKKFFDGKQAELKKDEEKIIDLQKKFQKQTSVLSDAAKRKKAQEIQALSQQAREKAMKFQRELQKKENEYKQPIIKKLNEVIEEVSKAAGVDFTVDQMTTPLMYAAVKVDLTDKVIKAYDKKFSK